MQILQHPLHLNSTPLSLSSASSNATTHHLPTLFPRRPPPTTTIRMGGGPRTFPGGVSKWQWKRMQSKKAKQLLKARLSRERQIYEMRKRAELKAAVTNLERPWELVDNSVPNRTSLFSVAADEQLKVLADRFQKPGGFDLWSEKDGPQLFSTLEGLPTSRFFPKGVVHSAKPYGLGNGKGKKGVLGDGSRKNGEFVDGIQRFDDEDDEGFEDYGEFYGVENDGKKEKGFYGDGSRGLRRKGNGKLGDGGFVDGTLSSDEEDSDFSGFEEFNGEGRGRNHEGDCGKYDGMRGISQGGLRGRRGIRGGRNSGQRLGNGSPVGGHGISDGKNSDISGLRDSIAGNEGIDSRRGRGRNGGDYKKNGINSGRRLGSSSSVGTNENSHGKDSEFSSLRQGRGRSRGGVDYKKDGNRMAYRSQEEKGTKGIDSGRRNSGSGMRGGGRIYPGRGRNTGRFRRLQSEVYDMSLQGDGSYGIGVNHHET